MQGLLNFVPPVIAHRGVSSEAPENTMSAFYRVPPLGLQWIEFDVRLTQCGEVIVFHDDTLTRLTGLPGEVDAYPYAFLQQLDVGKWFDTRFASERIPTLRSVLDFAAAQGLSLNIELKPPTGREKNLVCQVLQLTADFRQQFPQRVLFSSFSLATLKILRDYAADVHIGLLLDEWRDDWREPANKLRATTIHVNHTSLTAARVMQVKQAGKQLLSYTVNSAAQAFELFHWGVDAVFSDVPAQILAVCFSRDGL